MYVRDGNTIKLALTTFFSGHSFRKTAHLIGVPKSTVFDWVKRLKNFYLRPRQTRKTRCSKFSRLYERVKDIVFRFVNHDPFVNLYKILLHVNSEFSPHESLSLTTLRRILKHCNVVKKTATIRTPPRNIEPEKTRFKKQLSELVSDKNRCIVSLDETCFVNQDIPRKGYTLKGKELYVCSVLPKRTKISSIVAISQDGAMWQNYTNGNINSSRFQEFFRILVDRLPERTVIIMDNISFHKSRCILHYAAEKKITVLYTPPYSPEFNPVENYFSALKHEVRHENAIRCAQKFFPTTVHKVMEKKATDAPFRKFFDHLIAFASSEQEEA